VPPVPVASGSCASIDKAGIRAAVAAALVAAGAPSVPRELCQQLNEWFLGQGPRGRRALAWTPVAVA